MQCPASSSASAAITAPPLCCLATKTAATGPNKGIYIYTYICIDEKMPFDQPKNTHPV